MSYLKYLVMILLSALTASTLLAKEGDTTEPPGRPKESGLPVIVQTAVHFLTLDAFDENEGLYDATFDLRLTWFDLKRKYPIAESINGYKEFRGSQAEKQIAELWIPNVRITNQEGEPKFVDQRLRFYPEGRVELIRRITAQYKIAVDVQKFPFDRQALDLFIRLKEDTTDNVLLTYQPSDIAFSHAAKTLTYDGWKIGLVNLQYSPIKGWNGDRYSQVTASLEIMREPATTIPSVFIPLIASLFIPFLALWLNRRREGEFATDAFELANIVIGGLFSVVALSFTISSSYKVLAAGENTVTRLLGLNYLTLAICMGVAVILYQVNYSALKGPSFQY